MSHQEKQEIFDQYAKSKGFENWFELISFSSKHNLRDHINNVSDLVQEEQQKRIAEKEETISGDDFYFSGVPVEKIINPENKIQ